ncbi:hypothetical protein BaRGS_00014567 [Batillaria attramentaria]|uniref:Uncharacterized protein n=1 Tax=Batillaria attramentaria TaxID=370345 RepID=A0ABD0L4P9_9CAEN
MPKNEQRARSTHFCLKSCKGSASCPTEARQGKQGHWGVLVKQTVTLVEDGEDTDRTQRRRSDLGAASKEQKENGLEDYGFVYVLIYNYTDSLCYAANVSLGNCDRDSEDNQS